MIALLALIALWMVQESLLTRATITNVAMGGGGGTTFMDAPVGSSDYITVQADMTGAANGDLGITVIPYEADGVTLSGATLPAQAGVGFTPTFGAGRVTALQQYNCQGIDKVRITFTNNNVGAQTLTRASWRAANW